LAGQRSKTSTGNFPTQNINRYFDTRKYKNGENYQLVYEELVKKGVITKNVLHIATREIGLSMRQKVAKAIKVN